MKKKVYITPALTQVRVQTESMVALSLFSGSADPNKPALGKEQHDWNIWGESAPAPQQNNLP